MYLLFRAIAGDEESILEAGAEDVGWWTKYNDIVFDNEGADQDRGIEHCGQSIHPTANKSI